MQANVGRSSIQDIAQPHGKNIDILLLQEPWIYHDLSFTKSKYHRAIESFSLLPTWHSQPRVFTYIRKNFRLRLFRLGADLSRDLAQVIVIRETKRLLPIWNFYNSSNDSHEVGLGLTTLLGYSDKPFFAVGDLNLQHPLWDSMIIVVSNSCKVFIDWRETKGLKLLNPTETLTHNRGGILDLAFCADECAKCEVCTELHTTLEHVVTLITSLL